MHYDNNYEKPTSREKQNASKALREARKEATAKAGEKAIAECLAMLADTPDPKVPSKTPCEHDYQPSKHFARSLQCTKCTNLMEAPVDPESVKSHEAPIECYEDLNR